MASDSAVHLAVPAALIRSHGIAATRHADQQPSSASPDQPWLRYSRSPASSSLLS